MSMIHIRLDESTRDELQALRRGDLAARARDRLEMVCLSDAGWLPARIADHLGYDYRTVLRVLHDFEGRGSAALFPRRRGPAPDTARREGVATLLRDLVGQDRTWTAAQLAEALGGRGVHIGPRQVRRYLKHLKAGYRRTRAGRAGEPEGQGGGRRVGAELPRRVGVRPVAALRLQLGPAGAAEARAARVPAGAAGQRAGGLPALW